VVLSRSSGTSSGGYLAYILRYAAAELFGISVSDEDVRDGTRNIERIAGRNAGTSPPSLTSRFRNVGTA
jgi:hypothetical protein